MLIKKSNKNFKKRGTHAGCNPSSWEWRQKVRSIVTQEPAWGYIVSFRIAWAAQ
jgi:hypothetical protein